MSPEEFVKAVKFTDERIRKAKACGLALCFPDCSFLHWLRDSNEIFLLYGCTYFDEAKQCVPPDDVLLILSNEEIAELDIPINRGDE